jgi:hypothetical protein
MPRSLFIGDSHTCGYWSHPTERGPGSYTYWNDNNYSESYAKQNNKPTAIYSMAGVTNRVYTDWLKSMFEQYDDIDEVFICLTAFNRFVLGFDDKLSDDVASVDHFSKKMESSDGFIDRYSDLTVSDKHIQLFNKPTYEDYDQFPGIDLDMDHGLTIPNLRKNTFMQVKLFFELNTFVEKRDFLLNVYAWDNICADHGAKLYLFNFTERLRFPKSFEYYGKLKTTTLSPLTVEKFFKDKNIDHNNYLIEDKEHYNKFFHDLIAEKYIPWLKNL